MLKYTTSSSNSTENNTGWSNAQKAPEIFNNFKM